MKTPATPSTQTVFLRLPVQPHRAKVFESLHSLVNDRRNDILPRNRDITQYIQLNYWPGAIGVDVRNPATSSIIIIIILIYVKAESTAKPVVLGRAKLRSYILD